MTGDSADLILYKHKNKRCNLGSVIFYCLSKHFAGIFVWTNLKLRLFARRDIVQEKNVFILC